MGANKHNNNNNNNNSCIYLFLHLFGRQDLVHMCRLLNMDDVVDDIIDLLGISNSDLNESVEKSSNSRISFDAFMHCRLQLSDDQRPRLEALQSQLPHSDRTQLDVVTLRDDINVGEYSCQ